MHGVFDEPVVVLTTTILNKILTSVNITFASPQVGALHRLCVPKQLQNLRYQHAQFGKLGKSVYPAPLIVQMKSVFRDFSIACQ